MRTVEWDNGTVKMIDQRLLPTEYTVVTWTDVIGVARSIREMYVRGAPAIGATAAFGMALAAHTSPATNVAALRSFLAGLPVDGLPVILVTHQVTISAITGEGAVSGGGHLLELNGSGSPRVLGRIEAN